MTAPEPRLGVPALFGHGRYEQVLISTFGADLEFYERILRRHFGSYRNQIVLADSEMLRTAVAGTTTGTLRHVNRSWLAGPVRTLHSAHGKLILLAGPKAGLLLVGSGNLSISGYAGGGECFTPYSWSPEEPEQLDAFTAVRAMTEALTAHGYLDAVTVERLGVFWAAQDWWHTPPDPQGPVRHNLTTPLGEQLVAALNGEQVEELVVAAPFHDQRCAALERLLTTLAPKQTRVLLQPGRCSVDPAALTKVLSRHGAHAWAVDPIGVADSTYLHAKIFLVKTAERAVCLTGSANCSQVALWRTHPDANVELGNLLTGPRDAFDHLLAAEVVRLTGPAEPATLGVSIQVEDATSPVPDLRVEDLRWVPPRLTGVLHRHPVDLDPAAIVVEMDGRAVAAHVVLSAGPAGTTVFTATITQEEDRRALEGVTAVTVRVGPSCSAPTVPYQLERLREQDRRRVDIEQLREAARMDLDDPDLQQALVALEEILIGDRAVRWTHDTGVSTGEGDSDETYLSWDDIDWSTVKAHPRFTAYQLGSQLGAVAGSDLAAYLAGLAQAVAELADEAPASTPSTSAAPSSNGTGDPDDDDDDLDESEGSLLAGMEGADLDDDEQEQFVAPSRRVSYEARNLRVLRNFVRRNLRALESATFREQAGPGVVVPNVIILNWIMWWVATKDPDRASELVDERLRLWALLWGSPGTPGCLDGLDSVQADLVTERLDEQRFHAVVIASVISVWEVVEVTDPRFRTLRGLLRQALVDPLWHCDSRELERAARLNNSRPGSARHLDAAGCLDILWDVTWRRISEQDATRAVAAAAGVAPTGVVFSVERVLTESGAGQREVWQATIAGDLPDLPAVEVLRTWLGAEDAKCYRLKWSHGVALYDPATASGFVYLRATDVTEDLEDLEAALPPWAQVLEAVEVTMPRRRRTVA